MIDIDWIPNSSVSRRRKGPKRFQEPTSIANIPMGDGVAYCPYCKRPMSFNDGREFCRNLNCPNSRVRGDRDE